MFSFYVNILLLIRAFSHGMRRDPQFRALGILLLVLLAGGTLFYWRTEDWSMLDSLYFCVMTVSTIGYGDLVPTSGLSKGFTMAFAILGIGLFASFVAKLVTLRLDMRAHKRPRRSRRRKPDPGANGEADVPTGRK